MNGSKILQNLKENDWRRVDHEIQSVQGILQSIRTALKPKGDVLECLEGAYAKLENIRTFAITRIGDTETDFKKTKQEK